VAARVSEVGGVPWCRGSLKTDGTLDVRNAAAAFRLRNRCCDGRHRVSSMTLRAGWVFTPHAPWRVRAGRLSKRVVMRAHPNA